MNRKSADGGRGSQSVAAVLFCLISMAWVDNSRSWEDAGQNDDIMCMAQGIQGHRLRYSSASS
jgi:hypothetical protein